MASRRAARRGCVVVLMLALLATAAEGLLAEQSSSQSWPTYQRKSQFASGPYWGGHASGPGHAAPPVSAGWFQRPYPYHLDYYRMRYGGSYAPYFGNLYGPPNVVVAPPYYGGYGYGGYGPYSDGYGYPPGYPYPPSAPYSGYESGGAMVVPPADAEQPPSAP